MATTLLHFSTFFSLSSHKLSLHHRQMQFSTKLCLNTQEHSSRTHFTLRASLVKKSRGKRKVKSNEVLCNDIREFVSAFGFPEDHVPSTKELMQHGRSDLANIVRRRGYKFIRELLINLSKEIIDGLNTKESLAENQSTMSNVEDKLTGQDEIVNSVAEDISLTTKASISRNFSGGSNIDTDLNSDDHYTIPLKFLASSVLDENDHYTKPLKSFGSSVGEEKVSYAVNGQDEKFDSPIEIFLPTEGSIMGNCSSTLDMKQVLQSDHSSVPVQSSTSPSLEEVPCNLDYQDEHANKMAQDEDISLSNKVVALENYSGDLNVDLDLKSSDQNFSPVESSSNSSLEENQLHNLESQLEKVNSRFEDFSLSTVVSEVAKCSSIINVDADLNSRDCIEAPMESSISLSLKEKAANFIQNGYLDTIEDHRYDIFNESGDEEGKRVIKSGKVTEIQSRVLGEEHIENVNSGGNAMTTLDGTTWSLKEVAHPLSVNHHSRDDYSLAERPTDPNFDKDVDVKTVKKENLLEINHLKLMLHQKEMELSRLKEQVEREKLKQFFAFGFCSQLALSVLQNNVATEISKAQKLISEKDEELNAAEESLSGLKEVQIQYCGDGDIVEVAGSFNGWHQQIKMDPQPSSSIVDPIGARKPRLWSTVLWLYPGIYEVKFIVDGQWKIDPQRETVTRGTICNNILRVDI